MMLQRSGSIIKYRNSKANLIKFNTKTTFAQRTFQFNSNKSFIHYYHPFSLEIAKKESNATFGFFQRRFLSTPVEQEELSLTKYMHYLNETLEYLSEQFSRLEDHLSNEDDFDVELTDGVLKVNLGQYGSYVLNKQTPNKQLWLSSPISGPKRYKWSEEQKKWINTRDDHCLIELLNREFKQLVNYDLKLSPTLQ